MATFFVLYAVLLFKLNEYPEIENTDGDSLNRIKPSFMKFRKLALVTKSSSKTTIKFLFIA